MDFVTNDRGKTCWQVKRYAVNVRRNAILKPTQNATVSGSVTTDVYLRCDVDHDHENDHPIGMLTGWVENGD